MRPSSLLLRFCQCATLAFWLAQSAPAQTPQTPQTPHAAHTDAIQPVEPPFGMEWGESPDNVKLWAQENEHPMVEGKTKEGRWAIEIEGPFPGAEFDRLRFYFTENQLTEVELQFIQTGPEEDGVEFSAITQAMAVKEQVDARLGKGTLIKNEKGQDASGEWNFIQQIWTDEEHSIWLAIFTAKNPKKGCLCMTSLHYRWEKKLGEKLDKKSKASQ